jgi:hypothetical protein
VACMRTLGQVGSGVAYTMTLGQVGSGVACMRTLGQVGSGVAYMRTLGQVGSGVAYTRWWWGAGRDSKSTRGCRDDRSGVLSDPHRKSRSLRAGTAGAPHFSRKAFSPMSSQVSSWAHSLDRCVLAHSSPPR